MTPCSSFHPRASQCLEMGCILTWQVGILHLHQGNDYVHACISHLPTGHGLVVRHFRQNDECGALEELQPIDENRRYDFNYQQMTHLPKEVSILPVSFYNFLILMLLCTTLYNVMMFCICTSFREIQSKFSASIRQVVPVMLPW